MEEKIGVILVNYNGKKYNDACIASILRSTIREQIQVFVVDNASTDGSFKELQSRWKDSEQVQLFSLDANYGFSRANNEGICRAMECGIDYYLLLNNDTEIEPDTIERMLDCHLASGKIVVPKVLYADRRDILWCAGGEFTPLIRKAVQRGLDRKDEGQFDEAEDCRFANGCAMFLSGKIVEKIGLLDERFFLYYEDTEYSMRALEAGVGIRYCPQAVVYHKVNGSTGGNERPANAYYITRNWLLCNRLHMGAGRRFCGRYGIFLFYFMLNRSAWMVIWLLQGKRKMCVALLEGIRDFRKEKWGKYSLG